MEKYVCSLELSQKLEDLGVQEESEFYWGEVDGKTQVIYKYEDDIEICRNKVSAFTVGELGDMFPADVKGYSVLSYKGTSGYYFATVTTFRAEKTHPIQLAGKNSYLIEFREKSEADVRAKMLIHLIENKIK